MNARNLGVVFGRNCCFLINVSRELTSTPSNAHAVKGPRSGVQRYGWESSFCRVVGGAGTLRLQSTCLQLNGGITRDYPPPMVRYYLLLFRAFTLSYASFHFFHSFLETVIVRWNTISLLYTNSQNLRNISGFPCFLSGWFRF